MNWYYKIQGGHTHVRVFMNGGKCGDLCFRNEEFEEVKARFIGICEDAGGGYSLLNFIPEQNDTQS